MTYSLATLKVLRAFLDDPAGQAYGLELIDRTGVKAGALYPILSRLEDQGWVRGEWEVIDEAVAGRRRRRYYRLTDSGAQYAHQVLSETAALLRPPRRSMRRARPAAAPAVGLA
jgi:DNA-binding PadR family transcriptional regulator